MLPLALALLAALFLAAPIAIVVPMSFSTAISFQFPPPGYWLGYYVKYFTSEEWLTPTVNSLVIALGAMTFTMLLVVPAAFGFVRYRFRGKAFVNFLIMSPLVVPHVVRLLVGPAARRVLPLSALVGAALLAAADLVARLAGDLPVGVVMALIGAPFFLYLLTRSRAGYEL